MKTIHLDSCNENFLENSNFVKGVIHTISVKPGIFLSLADYSLKEPVRFRFSTNEEKTKVMGIGFCLSGYGHSHPECLKKPFDIIPGESIFYSFPSGIEFCETIKSKKMLNLTISIETCFIESCLKEFSGFLPDESVFLSDNISHNSKVMSGDVQNLINQILCCPFSGISRKFFLEAKVMEILSNIFQENSMRYSKKTKKGIKPEDIKKIQKTAAIIKLSADNFKNLESIAKSVGMCRSRLHEYFSLVYGVTPFEYLREFRVETAKSFLLNDKMSIREISSYLGFANTSHFDGIFKKMVGILPGDYKKKYEDHLINKSVVKKR